MASQNPPKKNTAYTHYFSLWKNDGTLIVNPGTYTKKVSIDGGAMADIAASVTEEDTTYGQLSIVIAAGEMNGDTIWGMIKDDTSGCVPHVFVLNTTAYTLDEIMAEIAKIPKSDSNVSWNATALAAINAEVDGALNTAIPGSPTADSINERIVNMEGTAIPAIKTVVDTIQADTDLLDDVSGGLADIHADIATMQGNITSILADTNELQTDWANGGRLDLLIDAHTTEIAKIPKSDSNVTWNATALAAINAEVDTALNTAIPGSPAADSINERIATMDGTAIPAIKTVVDTIQADTDLLDDVSGGLADIHTDVAAVKTVVDTIQADTDLLDDAIGGLADIHTDIADIHADLVTMQGNVTDILADTNELQLEFVDGGRLDLIIDAIVADTNELQTEFVDGGRLDLLIDQILADTNEIQTDWTNGGRLDLLLDQTLADTNELQTDNTDGGRTDLLIDSIITKVDALAVATVGLGACTWAYTLTDSVTALPIEGAEVWVTTDLAGTHMVAHGFTNASGVVTFFLDAGTNYFWRQHGSYTFTNPDTEIVS